jgi:hypothetical protein
LENTGRLEYCVSQKEFEQHGWSIAATDIELSDLIGSGDFAGKTLDRMDDFSIQQKLSKNRPIA